MDEQRLANLMAKESRQAAQIESSSGSHTVVSHSAHHPATSLARPKTSLKNSEEDAKPMSAAAARKAAVLSATKSKLQVRQDTPRLSHEALQCGTEDVCVQGQVHGNRGEALHAATTMSAARAPKPAAASSSWVKQWLWPFI